MFGNKKTEPEKTVKKFNTDNAVTILTKGCNFNGKLFCKGSTRIAGDVEGSIISEGLLVVEESAVIQANIQAEEVVVHGKIRGTITSKGRVALAPSCWVEGDIHSPALVIAEGARFNGKSDMIVPGQSTSANGSGSGHTKKSDGPVNIHMKNDTQHKSDVKIAARTAEEPA